MNSDSERQTQSKDSASGEASGSPDLWIDIEDKTLKQPAHVSRIDLWELTESHLDYAKYKPTKIADAEVAEVSDKIKEKRYALRNPHRDKYIILGDKELFLWNLIDGKNTVKDIVLEYVSKYDILGAQLLLELLSTLKDNGFLEDKPVSVFQSLKLHFRRTRILAPFMSVLIFLVHGTMATRKADEYFGWLYKHGARRIFTGPLLIAALILFIADITFFIYFFFIQHTGLLISLSYPEDHVYDDFALFILNFFIAVIIHEHAHALTVKAYGRKVLRGGVMLYFGLPMAFADTTDVWMKPRKARILVSFAGPFSNAVLGGIFFSMAAVLPDDTLRSILLQAGILNTTLFFFNILPIAETDGHYIVQDYLEIPRLQTRALEFIIAEMWHKLAKHERWGKNDWIFFLYGLIFTAGILYILYLSVHLWTTTVQNLFKAVLMHPVLAAEILSVIAAIMVIFVIIRLCMLGLKHAYRIDDLLQSRIEKA